MDNLQNLQTTPDSEGLRARFRIAPTSREDEPDRIYMAMRATDIDVGPGLDPAMWVPREVFTYMTRDDAQALIEYLQAALTVC